MAGTFSQIYIQVVFAVQGRETLLQKPWREEVFKYMAGIIKGKNQKPIIINGISNHVHLFIGLKPSMALSDLVRDVKNNTSNFINNQKFVRGKFSWQEGFGSLNTSIWNSCKNLKQNMTKSIYLIGMKINITPAGFMVRSSNFFYNHYSPSGLRNTIFLFLNLP